MMMRASSCIIAVVLLAVCLQVHAARSWRQNEARRYNSRYYRGGQVRSRNYPLPSSNIPLPALPYRGGGRGLRGLGRVPDSIPRRIRYLNRRAHRQLAPPSFPSFHQTRRNSENSIQRSEPKNVCWLAPTQITCDPNARYRTIDGSCNNLRHPTWGQSIRPLARMLPPQYEAGTKSKLRVSGVDGRPLPSTRKVSTTIHELASDRDLSHQLSHMHMLWGQFIDHDLGHTPLTPKVKCCNGQTPANRVKDCIPIPIPYNDPFWGNKGKTCMELRRSMALGKSQCGYLKYTEQINNVTSVIDASAIYGSDDKRAKMLRSYEGGLMKLSSDNYLPIEKPNAPETHDCSLPFHGSSDRRCFAAGDKRSNVWSGLTAIHELFVKEHNRIASLFYSQLGEYHPHMSHTERDETAYQEARRITGAMLQVINYKEYLPDVFGKTGMRKWRLNLGQHETYNPRVNPTITNVFSTAAFRFGHSQIPFGNQPKTEDWRNSTKFVNYEDTFNQPYKYREESVGLYNTIRGVIVEPALKMNPRFSDAVRDKLFARSFNESGLDLTAVNNQRGREHGLQGYNAWRDFCGLRRVSFDYMPDHTDELRRKFASLYNHPDDIDLFTGAITERLVSHDAQLGPTFSCLLGIQFKRVKEGDRFWFENQGTYPNPFTSEQIRQLSEVTLSKVICDNTYTDYLPANAFRLDTPMVGCDNLPALDLENWLKY